MKKAHKHTKNIWNINAIQSTTIFLLVFIGVLYLLGEYVFVRKLVILSTGLLLLDLVKDLLSNHLSYKNQFYSLSDEVIVLRSGAWSISETTIPLKRVQHVDIEQTFVSRWFHLYKLNIYTAGDDHSIEFITKEDADHLKDLIVDILSDEGEDRDE